MLSRQLLRKLPPASFSRISRRLQSSSLPPNPTPSSKTQARATKVLDRVPRFLRKYTDGLRHAPVSHVVSFLILHELTAIVPLVGLASWFHYTKWLPPFFSESAYIATGVEKFGNYFRRKGWFGLGQDDTDDTGAKIRRGKRAMAWNVSEAGTRIVVEVATAYAVTKALLPLRLVVSVWATPWFARTVMGRVGRGIKTLVGRNKAEGVGTASASAARMGATRKGASAIRRDAAK